jgi:hypothetical protein
MGCGVLFFGVLVFFGCCQAVSQTYFLVGVIGWGSIIRIEYGSFCLKKKKNMVPLCLIWTLWRERNRRIFENVEHTDAQLHEFFASMLYEWTTAWGFTNSTSILSFLDSLHIPSNSTSL